MAELIVHYAAHTLLSRPNLRLFWQAAYVGNVSVVCHV